MIDKLNNLLERMKRAKRTTVFALLGCDKDETQNIIWIDSRLEFWIKDLEEILVPPILSEKHRSRVTGVSDEEHKYYEKHGKFPEWSPYNTLPRTIKEDLDKMREEDTACPNCGSTRFRIVYKDDEGVDLDFYDCLLCPYTWV